MKIINYDELIFTDKDNFSSGSYGTIKKCVFDEKIYACKEFKDRFYLLGKRRMLDQLSKVENEDLYTPKFWVKKKDKTFMYLTHFCDGKDIDAYEQYPINEKIKLLKQTKDIILSMHDEGIIHADLSGSNIMVSKEGNPCIIDFDSASFKNHMTNAFEVNDFSQAFIKEYGVKKEIDIFLFNLLTFSIINECEFYLCRKNILNNNFGFFDNKNAKKICNSLFLEDKIPNNDFLIDAIDETNFTL